MSAHRRHAARVFAFAASNAARLVLLLALALIATGCVATAAPTAPEMPSPGIVIRECTTDADCAVKNVGNCCGYYPACVNRDSPVFPERVKAECLRNNMAGICGFPEIKGCTCVAGSCSDVPMPAE